MDDRRATALGQEDSAEASASLRSCFRLSTLNSTLLHFFKMKTFQKILNLVCNGDGVARNRCSLSALL